VARAEAYLHAMHVWFTFLLAAWLARQTAGIAFLLFSLNGKHTAPILVKYSTTELAVDELFHQKFHFCWRGLW